MSFRFSDTCCCIRRKPTDSGHGWRTIADSGQTNRRFWPWIKDKRKILVLAGKLRADSGHEKRISTFVLCPGILNTLTAFLLCRSYKRVVASFSHHRLLRDRRDVNTRLFDPTDLWVHLRQPPINPSALKRSAVQKHPLLLLPHATRSFRRLNFVQTCPCAFSD
jgi:hypothetical protein